LVLLALLFQVGDREVITYNIALHQLRMAMEQTYDDWEYLARVHNKYAELHRSNITDLAVRQEVEEAKEKFEKTAKQLLEAIRKFNRRKMP
jgi:hypothetical protein